MFIYYLFFAFPSFVASLSDPNTFEIDISATMSLQVYTSAFIGIPAQKCKLYFSSDKNDIVLYPKAKYNIENSFTYILQDQDWHNHKFSFLDTLAFNDTHVFEKTLISQMTTSDTTKDGHFGWWFLDNPFWTRWTETYKWKKIFHINLNRDKLIIGGYPSTEDKKYKSAQWYKKCNFVYNDSPNQRWGYFCKVDSMYFRKKDSNAPVMYGVNEWVSFAFGANAIYVPKEVFKFISNEYWGDLIKMRKCSYIKTPEWKYVICRYGIEVWSYLNPIRFLLGEHALTIGVNDLFLEYDEDYYFRIAYDEEKPGWTFGYPLFKTYLTVFDAEDNKIVFIPKA